MKAQLRCRPAHSHSFHRLSYHKWLILNTLRTKVHIDFSIIVWWSQHISNRRLISDSVVLQEVNAALRWWLFLSKKFLGSGSVDVEAALLPYRQCMCFCKFWCNTFAYRAKLSKPYMSSILNIAYMNLIIYNLTCMWYISITSQSFNFPLCCQIQISTVLPNFGYLTCLRLSSIRN
jgi:hypothetical protein